MYGLLRPRGLKFDNNLEIKITSRKGNVFFFGEENEALILGLP